MVSSSQKLRDKRIAAGLCRECGKPATEGMKTCDTCRERLRAKGKTYYDKAKGRILEMDKLRRQKLKAQVLAHYGSVCACCGEDELQFLSLDHVNNDGATHRKNLGTKTGGKSDQILRQIINAGYPDTFQILCFNCNWSKHLNGGECIHKLKEQ